MTRVEEYRAALLAVFPEVPVHELERTVDSGGSHLVSLIVDHGLGPRWHERTGRDEFRASRRAAEALYLAQESALIEVSTGLSGAGIDHVVFKGAANRLLLHKNPAIRACFDLDLLVSKEDRVRAAKVLVDMGYKGSPAAHRIGVELLLSRDNVDIDLHWRLVKEGRLRNDVTTAILSRRQRSADVWMLAPEDALFVLLVHPAFAKHLGSWEMGFHRVVDILDWLSSQSLDWQAVCSQLGLNGVRTAAWATLRWVETLAGPYTPSALTTMMEELKPGRLRQSWIDLWLRNDLSNRLRKAHWLRLLGLSLFLHDTASDSVRAVAGRRSAHKRRSTDLADFAGLGD